MDEVTKDLITLAIEHVKTQGGCIVIKTASTPHPLEVELKGNDVRLVM